MHNDTFITYFCYTATELDFKLRTLNLTYAQCKTSWKSLYFQYVYLMPSYVLVRPIMVHFLKNHVTHWNTKKMLAGEWELSSKYTNLLNRSFENLGISIQIDKGKYPWYSDPSPKMFNFQKLIAVNYLILLRNFSYLFKIRTCATVRNSVYFKGPFLMFRSIRFFSFYLFLFDQLYFLIGC